MERIQETKLLEEYVEVVSDDEKLLYQQAKIKWLSEKDGNTSFFHKILKGKANKSKVFSICDEAGLRYEGDLVAPQFLNILKTFLERFQWSMSIDSSDHFVNTLNHEDAGNMVKDVTDVEIKEALFDIDDSEAP
ncbi:hypothetical protein Tco_0576556 [Tanacetum coccineum]